MAVRVAREEGTRSGSFFFHIEDGYHYHRSFIRQGTTYFKCVLYDRGCHGRSFLDAEGFHHSKQHNHEPDLMYPDEMALRRRILARCANLEYLPFQQIIYEEGRRFPAEVVERVTYVRMRTPMRNARMKNFPNPPDNLDELSRILQNPQYAVLTMTDDGQDNIYGGSVTDGDGSHHILFMSERMLQRALRFSVIHSDGTFKTVPHSVEFADQIFCLVAVWTNHIIALGWALMSRRTEVAYSAVLSLLRQLMGPRIELRKAITDFETGQQNAWQRVFQVSVQGCLWHLCKSFIQEVAVLNLIVRMRQVEEVRTIIRLTMGLALLPQNLIVQGHQVILTHAREEGRYIYRIVRPYLTYVWRYWVSRPWRRRRMCLHGSKQRTNNCCERNNHVMNGALGTHSNIFLFLAGLVRMEQRAHNNCLSLEAHRRPNRGRKRSSIINDNRVIQATAELLVPPGPLNAAIFRFLSTVTHTMDGMVEDLMRDRIRGE